MAASPLCVGDFCVPATQVGVTPDGACVDGVSAWKNVHGYLNYLDKSYDGSCSFFGGTPALPEGLGWFLIIGVGAIFAIFTSAIVFLTNQALANEDEKDWNNSEHFSTAGRTISAGITAADVVSKWTWAATLLQSSNVAYKFGISGPFWYASGATIQVLLFAILAIEIKRKCPAIHTVLEVVLVRWGDAAHLVFLFFCLLTNLIVTAMLILGGSAVVNALTGVSTYAASFLIPLGVVGYTAFGGLKGTYYASYTHTAIIYIALLTFMFKVYAGPSDLGSTDKVHTNLAIAAIKNPVDGNNNGSHLTMFSRSGLIFGIVNIVGNFGTVFVDQSYWQGAIACRPSATYKGYLLGGMCWFAIPFSMATTLGLAGRALDLPITIDEAGQGLVPPAVAVHLMGQGGAFLVVLQLFLAVTSTANSEQLAVASLFAYDVYKRYINPNATASQIIFVSRAGVLFWGIFSGVISVILFEIGIGLGWVYMAMGNFIGCAVAPITFALTWKDCSSAGAIGGAVGGLIAAMVGWIVAASSLNGGVVDKNTLGQDYPMLTGNLLSLCISPIICVLISLAAPQNFDWAELTEKTGTYLIEEDRHAALKDDDTEDGKAAIDRAYAFSLKAGGALTFVLIILWPLLTLPQDPFSKSYFGWWVTVAFIWGLCAAFFTVVYPLWEMRLYIGVVLGCISKDEVDSVRGEYRLKSSMPAQEKAAEPAAVPPQQPYGMQPYGMYMPGYPASMPAQYPMAPPASYPAQGPVGFYVPPPPMSMPVGSPTAFPMAGGMPPPPMY
jgi:SSS family transporter